MSRAAQSKLLALVMHACQHCGRFDSVCDEEKGRRQNSRTGKDKKAGAAMPFMKRAGSHSNMAFGDLISGALNTTFGIEALSASDLINCLSAGRFSRSL
jgi:hypothetical protein